MERARADGATPHSLSDLAWDLLTCSDYTWWAMRTGFYRVLCQCDPKLLSALIEALYEQCGEWPYLARRASDVRAVILGALRSHGINIEVT